LGGLRNSTHSDMKFFIKKTIPFLHSRYLSDERKDGTKILNHVSAHQNIQSSFESASY